ncbi:Huntingtin-interacting K-like protein [Quillaja saponaria]|uniref:Huntingtin-interacting K-like protein n=1 Tax=Quillaja saponaria TaxID=32244 RepID=A0AAD7QFD1_QUISA|nr:Huntingtin-interacting K-like protein [Quillaja saponaria]
MASIAASADANCNVMRMREKELAAVKIYAADVDIIANELELDKVAERTLREHKVTISSYDSTNESEAEQDDLLLAAISLAVATKAFQYIAKYRTRTHRTNSQQDKILHAGPSAPKGKKRKFKKGVNATKLSDSISRLSDLVSQPLESPSTRSCRSSISVRENKIPSMRDVMRLVGELPGFSVTGKLFTVAAKVMQSVVNRETFVALKDLMPQMNWLKIKVQREMMR